MGGGRVNVSHLLLVPIMALGVAWPMQTDPGFGNRPKEQVTDRVEAGDPSHEEEATQSPIAAEYRLVMVEEPGCFYCARWLKDIAPIYPKTALGKDAPLQRIEKSEASDAFSLDGPVIYTPTFILVDDNKVEISRLEGYQSEDFFWALAEEMLEEARRDENLHIGKMAIENG